MVALFFLLVARGFDDTPRAHFAYGHTDDAAPRFLLVMIILALRERIGCHHDTVARWPPRRSVDILLQAAPRFPHAVICQLRQYATVRHHYAAFTAARAGGRKCRAITVASRRATARWHKRRKPGGISRIGGIGDYSEFMILIYDAAACCHDDFTSPSRRESILPHLFVRFHDARQQNEFFAWPATTKHTRRRV